MKSGVEYVYLLELQDGCYYVGWTRELYRRIGQHFLDDGAQWTTLHKPIKVLYVWEGGSKRDEERITSIVMKKFGIDKVRGAGWTRVDGKFLYPPKLHKVELIELDDITV